MDSLLRDISKCQVCQEYLPMGPRPIVAGSENSPILIIGQAPGKKVHESGIPWDDQSGARLRDWMNLSTVDFYNKKKVALLPMGFCYPGKGKSGDLPPRPECAPLWHPSFLNALKGLKLRILIGSYAQQYYLGDKVKNTLTETVEAFETYLPHTIVLPHPSPRNNIWLKKNPWFEDRLVPQMQTLVASVLS